jgi:Holliday junction resolvase-like predicted endonuclease
VNKTAVKIIKRKDTEAAAEVKTQNTGETKSAAAISGEKIERSLHRKMAETVSNWISERRENNRTNEISAIRNLFGDESLLSKTA